MSLFGTTSGFGTSGTGMFGSTSTDNHNPMKVPEGFTGPAGRGSPGCPQGGRDAEMAWEPPLG